MNSRTILDSNVNKIKQTHDLIDQIEERVKLFIQKDNPINKSYKFEQLDQSNYAFMDNSIQQSKQLSHHNQLNLLKEIKDVDRRDKIDQEMQQKIIEEMQRNIDLLQDKNSSYMVELRQKDEVIHQLNEQIEYLKETNYSLNKENDLLREQVDILKVKFNDDLKAIPQSHINALQYEIQDERYRNELLIEEMSKIKAQLKDTYGKLNSDRQSFDQSLKASNQKLSETKKLDETLKRIEATQEKQEEYNKYIMKCMKKLQESQSKTVGYRYAEYVPQEKRKSKEKQRMGRLLGK